VSKTPRPKTSIQRKTALITSPSFHRICFIRRLLPLSKVITRDIMTSIGWLEDAGTGPWGNVRRTLCAVVGSFRFWVSLWGYAAASPAEGATGRGNQTENWNRKDVLAAIGGGRVNRVGDQYRMIAKVSHPGGVAAPIRIITTAATMATNGTIECMAMHNVQWPASLSTPCTCVTWATASSANKTRHTTAAAPKVLDFERRTRRKCARIAVNAISSRG